MFGVVYKKVQVGPAVKQQPALVFMVLVLMKCGYFGYKHHRHEHPLSDV